MHPLAAIELSRSALLHNLRQLRRALQPVKYLAVVKSNAYGHGVKELLPWLEKSGVIDWYGVANATEALELRKAGIHKPVLVLSYYATADALSCIQQHIRLVLHTADQIKLLAAAARKVRRKALVHLKIDTGAGRIGFGSNESRGILQRIAKQPWLELEGICSHFADAEEDQPYTQQQLRAFHTVLKQAADLGLKVPEHHIAASAAGLYLPASRFSMVRVGIANYGLWPSPRARQLTQRQRQLRLRPILSWTSAITQIKLVPKHTSISYGRTFVTQRASRLAVIPIGYADGYDRSLSNRSAVLVRGERCPVRGRICMNLLIADVTQVKKARLGDPVVLLGEQGRAVITAEELATLAGTINYEIVARLPAHLPRRMVA